MAEAVVKLRLTGENGELIRTFAVSSNAAEKFADAAERAMRKADSAAAALGNRVKGISEILHFEFLKEAAGTVYEFGKGILELGDELSKLSQKVGIPVETLSALRREAKLSNVDLDSLKTGLVQLSKTATEAAGGSKEQVAAFKAIGVEVKDVNGNLKPTAKILEEVAAKFASYKGSMAKASDANVFFGRTGSDLIPLLNAIGPKGLARVIEEAKKYGQVISTEAAEASARFHDNLTQLSGSVEGLAVQIGNQVIPELSRYAERWTQILTQKGQIEGYAGGVAGALSLVVQNLDAIAVYLGGRLAFGTVAAGLALIAERGSLAAAALSVFGGPVGILALVATGLYAWHTAAERARDGTDELRKAQQLLNGVTEDAAKANVAQIAELENLAISKLHAAEATLQQLEAEQKLERERNARTPSTSFMMAGLGPAPAAGHFADSALDAQRARIAALRANIGEMDAEIIKAVGHLRDLLGGGHASGEGGGGGNAPVLPKDLDAAAAAARRLANAEAALHEEVEKLRGQASPELKAWADRDAAINRLAQSFQKVVTESKGLPDAMAHITRAQKELVDGVNQANAAWKRQDDVYKDSIDFIGHADRALKEMVQTAGLDERARYAEAIALKAVEEAHKAAVAQDQAELELTPEAIAALKQRAALRWDEARAVNQARDAQLEFNQTLINGGGSAIDEFSQDLLRGTRGMRDFGKSLVDIAKRTVAQVLAEMLKLRILNPFLNGILGLSGTAQALPIASLASSSGSGGFLQSISNFFRGNNSSTPYAGTGSNGYAFQGAGSLAYGQLGSTGSFGNTQWGTGGGGAQASPFGGASGWGGALAGAAYGSQQGSGGLSTGIATVAGGVAGYYAAGVFTAAATGGIAAGTAALAAIPVVGWIALAAMAINAISGGKLFGTKFKTTGSGTVLDFGAGGFTGQNEVYQSRQRALFGGTQRRTNVSALDAETLSKLDEFWNQVNTAMQAGAKALGVEVAAVVEGTFKTVRDKKGNVKDQFSVVGGVTYHEDDQAFQSRILAENVIAQVAKSAADASVIAQQWRSNAAKLLDGAQLMLMAQADIVHGVGLLTGPTALGAVVSLVSELAGPGEKLAEAYARVAGATKLLEQAQELMGRQLDKSREDFVRFAAGIAEAAGGLDQATALWQNYFTTFYSPSERADAALKEAQRQRDRALTEIGESTSVTAAQFRHDFEQALPTLTPDQVVLWLRAGAAIGAEAKAEADLAAMADEATRQLQAQAAATLQYAAFMTQIEDQLADLSRSDFQKALNQIARAMSDNIAKANDLARAAGLAGAREADLSKIHELAATQAAMAARELEAAAGDSVARLYGAGQDAADALGNVADGLQRVADTAQSFREQMLLDPNLSPLNTQQQYQEALRQLRQTGDSGTGQRALELLRKLTATGADYNRGFDLVTSLVRPGADTSGAAGGGAGGGSSQLSASERLSEAQKLAQEVADIAGFRGESFADVAHSLNFGLDQLGADLGLGQDQLDEYLKSLQADSYTLDDLSTVITREVDRIVAAIEKEWALTRDATAVPVGKGGDVVVVKPGKSGGADTSSTTESSPATEGTMRRVEDKLDKLGDRFDRGIGVLAKISSNGATDSTVKEVVQVLRDGKRDTNQVLEKLQGSRSDR